MPRVLSIVGARPQFVKAAPVSIALEAVGVEEFLLHTGQHYDHEMSDVFFQELGGRAADENLAIGSGPHGAQTGKMLAAIEQCIEREKPDCVLVYGDTNSTIAGALAASKVNARIAHVEAGLRSFNRSMPEEVNRVVTDCLSDILFTPTVEAGVNLLKEGINKQKIFNTGDVMLDAINLVREKCDSEAITRTKYGLDSRPVVLVTIHRAANTDNRVRLVGIMYALKELAEELNVVMPVHPRTKKCFEEEGSGSLGKVIVLPPIGYLEMLSLQGLADLVLTDSGGVQKEAFFCGVPCVTVREETEWIELLRLGWNTLADPDDPRSIVRTVFEKLGTVGESAKPYGSGDASKKIATHLIQMFS